MSTLKLPESNNVSMSNCKQCFVTKENIDCLSKEIENLDKEADDIMKTKMDFRPEKSNNLNENSTGFA